MISKVKFPVLSILFLTLILTSHCASSAPRGKAFGDAVGKLAGGTASSQTIEARALPALEEASTARDDAAQAKCKSNAL